MSLQPHEDGLTRRQLAVALLRATLLVAPLLVVLVTTVVLLTRGDDSAALVCAILALTIVQLGRE